MTGQHVLFWASVFLLGYAYLGYPALVWAWAAVRRRPRRRSRAEPTVSVLVVAHNEAARIEGRLENLFSVEYPRDRLEILLGSDGSTDGTAEIARAHEPAGVTVMAFERRRGKAAVLNDVMPKARGDIVVLADARQRFAPGAIRALVEPFGDPQVGAVSGELILTPDPESAPVGHGVGVYWRYEKFIRRNESRVDSTVGATGAVYAIRRELFEPIPDDTLLDDVLIPLRITRRGYRVLFEPGARAYDRAAATTAEEFARKVRTLAGNFQLFARERWAMNPFQNRLWLQTVSHKGLRLLLPLLHVGAFIANLPLADGPLYGGMLLAQALFYAFALGGYAGRNGGRRTPLLSVPYVICVLNCATLVGFLRFVTGRQRATWDHVSRPAGGGTRRVEEARAQSDRGGAGAPVLRFEAAPNATGGTTMPWRNVRSFLYNASSVRQNAPAASGVYGIFTPHEWIYIGESQDIQARLLQHLNGDNACISTSGATSFSFELVPAQQRAVRQSALVLEYQPACNR